MIELSLRCTWQSNALASEHMSIFWLFKPAPKGNDKVFLTNESLSRLRVPSANELHLPGLKLNYRFPDSFIQFIVSPTALARTFKADLQINYTKKQTSWCDSLALRLCFQIFAKIGSVRLVENLKLEQLFNGCSDNIDLYQASFSYDR